jgi:hypothetical protein
VTAERLIGLDSFFGVIASRLFLRTSTVLTVEGSLGLTSLFGSETREQILSSSEEVEADDLVLVKATRGLSDILLDAEDKEVLFFNGLVSIPLRLAAFRMRDLPFFAVSSLLLSPPLTLYIDETLDLGLLIGADLTEAAGAFPGLGFGILDFIKTNSFSFSSIFCFNSVTSSFN